MRFLFRIMSHNPSEKVKVSILCWRLRMKNGLPNKPYKLSGVHMADQTSSVTQNNHTGWSDQTKFLTGQVLADRCQAHGFLSKGQSLPFASPVRCSYADRVTQLWNIRVIFFSHPLIGTATGTGAQDQQSSRPQDPSCYLVPRIPSLWAVNVH